MTSFHHVEITDAHDELREADMAVVRRLVELGVDVRRPILTGLDVALPGPGAVDAVVAALQAAGLQVLRRTDRTVHTLGLAVLDPDGPRRLMAAAEQALAGVGAHVDGWGAVPPRGALLEGRDKRETVLEAERLMEGGDVAQAADLLQAALHGGEPALAGTAAAMLLSVSVRVGDGHGGDELFGWAAEHGHAVWGGEGALAFALEVERWTDADEDAHAAVRMLLEQLVERDPRQWGLPAGLELSRLLVHAGDPAGARQALTVVASGPSPAMRDRAEALLAELTRP